MGIPALPFGAIQFSSPLPFLKELELTARISQHLKHKRLQLRLLQKDIAKLLNVCEDTVTGWENDRCEPLISQYPGIIQFLGYIPFRIDENTLGGRIWKYRVLHGMSQKEFADLVQVNETSILAWEADKRMPLPSKHRVLEEILTITEPQ